MCNAQQAHLVWHKSCRTLSMALNGISSSDDKPTKAMTSKFFVSLLSSSCSIACTSATSCKRRSSTKIWKRKKGRGWWRWAKDTHTQRSTVRCHQLGASSSAGRGFPSAPKTCLRWLKMFWSGNYKTFNVSNEGLPNFQNPCPTCIR